MRCTMVYLWPSILVLLNTIWLMLVVFGLPGNWLIVIPRYIGNLRFDVGAGVGEFLGITSKFALGIVIWFIVAIASFWP